jgi:DNA repair exonuclease SbcCD ATPase subunit
MKHPAFAACLSCLQVIKLEQEKEELQADREKLLEESKVRRCPAGARKPPSTAALCTHSAIVPPCLQAAFEAFEAWHEEKGRLLEEADRRIAQLEQHTEQLQEQLAAAQEGRWAAAARMTWCHAAAPALGFVTGRTHGVSGVSCRQEDGELQHTLSELTAQLAAGQAAHTQLQARYSAEQAAWTAKEEGLAGAHRWQSEAWT